MAKAAKAKELKLECLLCSLLTNVYASCSREQLSHKFVSDEERRHSSLSYLRLQPFALLLPPFQYLQKQRWSGDLAFEWVVE